MSPESSRYSFVALGSNLGDSRRMILEAINRLQHLSSQPLLKSSLWQSEPIDCPPGSRQFINAVVGLIPDKDETPETLLAKLQSIEKEFGRQPKRVQNEPRPLDLDLISFGNLRRSTEQLTLPHPRAHLRRFVLEPLAEIAPELLLPGQCRTVSQLVEALGHDPSATRVSFEDCCGQEFRAPF